MTELLLNKGLATSEPDQPIRDIARSSTLAAVRQLDTDRKAILLQFLYESNLITGVDPIISLNGANLSGAFLFRANLNGANLSGAHLYSSLLRGANLNGTDLTDADLSGANLSSAILDNAFLSGANLNFADLSGANLSSAILDNAFLSGADLSFAFLFRANLSDADLRGADLSNARNLTNQQLAQARSLLGATLPNGTVMTEEGWEEFKKLHRK
jgi:uncharacterized protein YjbI with pentapeptide repeats